MYAARSGNIKSAVFVITLLTVLVSGTICSQLFIPPVFAAPPDPCFGKHSAGCANMNCSNDPERLQAVCCWNDIRDGEYVCQACQVNTDTGEFENCTDVLSKAKFDTSTIAPPPSGFAPPPSTETCPENTARDLKGNCTPMTQTPKVPVPKSGPRTLLPEGVFEQPETALSPEGPTGPKSLIPPITTEEAPQAAPPSTAVEEPTCPAGQELDEDTNLCVPVSQEQEEQQPEDGGGDVDGSSEDEGNSNDGDNN